MEGDGRRGPRLWWDTRHERAEGAVRVVEGIQDGVATQWTGGVAHLAPGHIRFVPVALGVRFLRRPPVDIAVSDLEAEHGRRTPWREVRHVTPELAVVRVRTSTAVLELAVRPSRVADVVAGVGASASDDSTD